MLDDSDGHLPATEVPSTRSDMPNSREMRFLEVKGMNIRVFSRNLGNGDIPLLILNGLGQSIEILLPLVDQLDGRAIVVFDMPGVGLSQMADGPLSIPQYTRIAVDILERLGLESFDVMGIYWGGSVTQQPARDHGDRCRKLILAITVAGGLASWWGNPIALSEILFPLRFTNKD